MKAHGHFLILSVPVVTLCLALAGCKHEPPALAATPPPVVMVSPPVEREIADYYEYTARTAAVEAVEVRARVSGYLVKVNFREGAVVKKGICSFRSIPAFRGDGGGGQGLGRPVGGKAGPGRGRRRPR